jgi:nitrilase
MYLCDYGDCNEKRFFTPGESLTTFVCQGWQIGIMVCADIRYPMLCRQLASISCIEREKGQRSSVLDTCQLILPPACFSRDLSFRTWKSFRETRAVENGVYLVATNYAGDYYGECSVTPPWVDDDHEPREWNNESGVYRAVLEKSAVQWARENMPYYRLSVQKGLKLACCIKDKGK